MDNNDLIFQVLKLYYLDRLTQQEIAEKFNIHRVFVARMLSKARDEGLIEFKINYPRNFSNPREEKLEKEFIKKYNLKECIIIKNLEDKTETLKEMSAQLSLLFDSIVSNNTFIGVGWGTTLNVISKYIQVREKKGIKVTPLMGSYGRYYDYAHSNSIARVIADKFNATSYVVNIPASFDTKEIKESILADSNVKEILKLTKMVDIATLCVGDLSKESSLYKIGELNDDDIYYLSKLGVIGDINYIFIDKNGKFVPNEISERTANLFPAELMKSVKNVIGVAVGARKAEVLRAVLKGGLINILMTDLDAGNKILEID